MTTILMGLAVVLVLATLLGVAPSPTARVTPTGIKLENGHRTTITFSADTNIELFEMEVTPIGEDNGEPIDTTTMWNNTRRTKSPRALTDSTPGSMTCGYDPFALSSCRALIGVENTITCTFPDGSTEARYGYLKSFVPGPLSPDGFPTAQCEFIATDADPTTSAEEEPVFTNVAGT